MSNEQLNHGFNQTISKLDMVSITIDKKAEEILSILFANNVNWMGDYGIIRFDTSKNIIILSCVDSQSRDELYQLMVGKLTSLSH